MITIIDYQAGNLKSLSNALARQGLKTKISNDPLEIISSPLVILPGVGAFGDAAEALESSGLKQVLIDRNALGKPILGICLGMQLLYEDSDESNTAELAKGLGLLKGKIRRLSPMDSACKVPHMGWNQLIKSPFTLPQLNLYEGKYAYFVHSYGLVEAEEDEIQFYTNHSQRIPSISYRPALTTDNSVIRGALMGFQFHPEKSGPEGEKLLADLVTFLLKTQ